MPPPEPPKAWSCMPSKLLVREASVIFYLLIAAYSCFVGSFFAVFVPQSCDGHECTFAENVYVGLTPFNVFVLVCNLAMACVLLSGFVYEFMRERWIILHFDQNDALPDDQLSDEITQFSALNEHLLRYNRQYFHLFIFICVFHLANTGVSIALISFYYNGYRSVTTFVTSFLIVTQRLARSLLVSHECFAETRAQSINLVEALNFNVVSEKVKAQTTGKLSSDRVLDVLGAGHVFRRRYGEKKSSTPFKPPAGPAVAGAASQRNAFEPKGILKSTAGSAAAYSSERNFGTDV
jgi:hypothetical protein